MSDQESELSDAEENCGDDGVGPGEDGGRGDSVPVEPLPTAIGATISSNNGMLATPARRKAQEASLVEPIPLGRSKGRGRGTTADIHRQRQRATSRSTTIPRGPPAIVRPDSSGALPMVNGHGCSELPESYTEDEHALNMFTKLHPMVRSL